jgi:hypothetical protein
MTGRALLNPKAAEHLVKLCGLLGSNHEGERANAGKLADDFVRKLGLRWSDVICIATVNGTPAEWQGMALKCEQHWSELTERERDFVANLRRLRKPPSDRQLEWLETIAERLERAHPEHPPW